MTRSVDGKRPRPTLQSLADAQSVRLREHFLRGGAAGSHPSTRTALILAWGLAALILLGYLAMTLYGIWGLIQLPQADNTVKRIVLLITAPVALMVAWVVRPTWGQRAGPALNQQNAPELLGTVAEVASALGVPVPQQIDLTSDLNASVGRRGRQTMLSLGLPLLYALGPQERVALIAHELAHDQAGDPRHSQLLGSAAQILDGMIGLLSPDALDQRNVPFRRLEVTRPDQEMIWFKKAMTLPFLGLQWIFQLLTGQHSQAAEFRADLRASRVAGSESVINLLDRLHFTHLLEMAVQRQQTTPQQPHALAELRQMWAELTPERITRMRAGAANERLRLDSSHPPTSDRLTVVGAHPAVPQLILSAERSARIDAELAPHIPTLTVQMAERYG